MNNENIKRGFYEGLRNYLAPQVPGAEETLTVQREYLNKQFGEWIEEKLEEKETQIRNEFASNIDNILKISPIFKDIKKS